MKHLNPWFSIIAITLLFAACKPKPQIVLNDKASLSSSDQLPENPLLLNPLTTSINTRDSTMSTLYGNDMAFSHAKKQANNFYPKGSLLYEVTWKQRPDSVWFGANIPREIFSVERISFNEQGAPVYEFYHGNPLKKSDSQNDLERIAFISSQRMAVSP